MSSQTLPPCHYPQSQLQASRQSTLSHHEQSESLLSHHERVRAYGPAKNTIVGRLSHTKELTWVVTTAANPTSNNLRHHMSSSCQHGCITTIPYHTAPITAHKQGSVHRKRCVLRCITYGMTNKQTNTHSVYTHMHTVQAVHALIISYL
jgi:hypothetical protein